MKKCIEQSGKCISSLDKLVFGEQANNFNIPLLDDYIKFCKCIFMYTIFHDLFPTCITNIFSRLFYLHFSYYELCFDRVNFSVCDIICDIIFQQ